MKNEGQFIAEKRGIYDTSRNKDAFILSNGAVRAGVFLLDESNTHVSVVVDMPSGGSLCYSVAFDEFVAALRNKLPQAAQPQASEQFKSGNEFLPFHHQASHVRPDYRDGWNACYKMAQVAKPQASEHIADTRKLVEIDCRQCGHFLDGKCLSNVLCESGDMFYEGGAVQLYRRGV